MTAVPVWLLFVQGGVLRALHRGALVGVIPRPVTTRVPGAPDCVLGLVAWRGGVLPLLRPGADAAPCEPREGEVAAAVVVQAGSGMIALAADSVDGWATEPGDAVVVDPSEALARCRVRVSSWPPRAV